MFAKRERRAWYVATLIVMTKPLVQQRSFGVIFFIEVLKSSTGPLQCNRELRQRVSCADPGQVWSIF
jgi:hypothetical protein